MSIPFIQYLRPDGRKREMAFATNEANEYWYEYYGRIADALVALTEGVPDEE